jgi:hypothetical protein
LVGAKVRRGFPIVEFEYHNSNRSIGDSRCCQEGLVMTEYSDSTTHITDRLPALFVLGTLRKIDSVIAVFTRTTASTPKYDRRKLEK